MTGRPDLHVAESLDALGHRMVDAWKRAEAGEVVAEDHLSFESEAARLRYLPPGALALMEAIEAHPSEDEIRLARRLGRSAESVRADIRHLISTGLIEPSTGERRQALSPLTRSA